MSDPIEYQIKGIEILEFNITEQREKLGSNITYGFGFNLNHTLDIDTNTISVICTLKISDADDNLHLGGITVACIFELTDFEPYVKRAPLKVNFPEHFLQSINSITLSTVRGISFSHFKGTFLHHAILPIVDIATLEPMVGNEPK